MASTSSTSISTFTPQWKYDVFLSFSGEDTRFNFTDRLYENLIRKGIHTFRDDSLTRGEEIAPELLKAIEQSRCSLIVFSENYARSRWCLDELVKIMKCRKEMKQTVIPIFYHVEPSHVRHQTGSFGKEAFSNYKEDTEEMKEKVRSWKSALTEAANISGEHVKDGYESKYIRNIVNKICMKSDCRMFYVGDKLVGMDSHVNEIIRRLCIDRLNDVRMIGICGTGGMGKTTIAKVVYNNIFRQFEHTSFLENVRDGKTRGFGDLQNQLLSDLQVEGYQSVSSASGQHATMIKKVLPFKRVFIVLDNIDGSDQFEHLPIHRNWLQKGSRVIITTRNKQLLQEMDDVYEVEKLNSEQAGELFSLFAFGQNLPQQDFIHLSDLVVRYCDGLPLALKVLGILLLDKTISEWKSQLRKLKRRPEANIQNVLKISYDELDDTQQRIFLDIACFFNGEDKDYVTRILDSCGLDAEIEIRVLYDKCLISFSKNKILMHDLIQKMGRNIIRSKFLDDPTEWSRLWNPRDVCRAFTMGEGMKNVEAIFLDLSRSTTPLQISTKIFAMMKKLRLLKIYSSGYCGTMEKQSKVILLEDFQFPAHVLRYLHWEGYPLKSLPSNSLGVNLVELNMEGSNIKQLWQGNENLERLKILNLTGSKQLTEISKFSNMPNLEKLELAHCTSLNVVDPSIGVLKKLTLLNLCGCENLRSLPSSIQYLDSLKYMNLVSCSNLEEFPEMEGSPMKALSYLHLDRCGIKELPSSIEHLTRLEVLFMSNCKNLRSLPRSICRLKSLLHIKLNGCSNLDTFPEITEDMKYLRVLDLGGTGIKELPSSQNLKSLWRLDMSNCLVTLPDSIYNLTSLKDLTLRGCCSNLEKFPKNPEGLCSLERLDLSHCNLMVSIPSGISQLCKLRDLDISHCKMLQDIPELPSSLREIDAHGCTKLEMLSSPSSLLWSSLLKWFNPTSNEHLNCKEGKTILILGNGGIPRWVSHQKIGSQVRIEPPLNWYEDDHFLGFAFFTLFRGDTPIGSQFSLRLRGDPDEVVDDRATWYRCTCNILNDYASDRLLVTLYPKNAIPSKYHCRQPWHFLADFVPMGNRRVTHSNNIKRCGVQLI